MITAEKIKCYHCSDELEGEDAESPMRDSAGNPYCERCYRDEIEGECDRCGEYVEQDKELAMRPGELLAGKKPTGSRLPNWPNMDGMITGYVLTTNLQWFAPLDDKGLRAADDARTPGGRLCFACRAEILFA
jgi:hypothetical protein